MLLPISVNLFCLDFDHEVSIRTTLLCCILLREICCCLYQRICAVLTLTTRRSFEFAVMYKCWKNCWMNLHVFALFAVFLTEKWTGFPKKCFLPKRLFQIFFQFIQHPFFWVVSTNTFVGWRHCNSWVTQCFLQNNLYHCYLIQFFWLVAKIAINFSN